jgi:hypothetical protein
MMRADLARAVERLAGLYPLPRHVPDVATMVEAWERELPRGLDPVAFDGAITAYVNESGQRYWPVLGELLPRAWRIQRERPRPGAPASLREYLAWEAYWGRRAVLGPGGLEEFAFAGCPVCGAVPGWHHGRLAVPHRASVHEQQGLPTIGWSDRVAAFFGQDFPGPPSGA